MLKVDVYSRRGVRKHWSIDWQQRSAMVYRRERGALKLTATLDEQDTLQSPLLPGFICRVAGLFANLP